MYNDEHNLYHYTYRKDGSEAEAHPAPQPGPVQDHNSGPQQPVQEMKPVKKNRIGLKVTALALCCALLGGAVGGGIVRDLIPQLREAGAEGILEYALNKVI